MEKETRQRLERLTQQARRLLEQEFREQLEGCYDILLDGRIPLGPGAHLSPRERVLWDKLVSAVAHKRSQGIPAAAAVAAYLREAAFHTLNRFVALKMLEARKLVQECISRGEDSAGFKEFIALAPGLVALPDKGYRLYVETIFDEIAQEVRAIFDRRDAATILWPRRQALLDLLAALNDPEVGSVWGEDETIGWVYQYFNGEDERRQMRAESQAPRNSRELAVRNQFFTPRYVVQFLTDNSLGRTWCEMRGADTQLAHLDYLVKPEEGFEERAPKDPRDLRVLDPACGSGHFLLYAFDLLAGDPTRSFFGIYEEAWRADAAPKSEVTGRTLKEDYDNELALRCAVPELVLKHNLHGVDIDPRAAQIAGLALWMRAQRAYNDHKVAAQDRPLIGRTNIVTAEPMPGDRSMVAEFASTLRPQVLGELFQRMVEEMRLAGELGSLLKIDRALQSAVAKAREQFVQEKREPQRALPGFERPRSPQLEFDLSGVSDESFFDSAEERIVEALQQYAAGAPASMSVRRQLFADDAAQGIAFIDLCRKRFDVVLMNPPFGLMPKQIYDYLVLAYPDSYYDLATAFMDRGLALAADDGFCAAITTRAFLIVSDAKRFRMNVFVPCASLIADLGSGVMDGAAVDSSAQVLRKQAQGRLPILNARSSPDKAPALRELAERQDAASSFERTSFEVFPNHQIAYDALAELHHVFTHGGDGFEPVAALARIGASTFDDERFLRARWEVSPGRIGSSWLPSSRTAEEFSLFYFPPVILVKWESDGREVCARNEQVNGQTAQARQGSTHYGIPGVVFARRSSPSIAFRAHPAGASFASNTGVVLPAAPEVSPALLLGLLNATVVRAAVNALSNRDSYTVGHIKRLKWPWPEACDLEDLASQLLQSKHYLYRCEETDPWFSPVETYLRADCPDQAHRDWEESTVEARETLLARYRALEAETTRLFRVADVEAVRTQFGVSEDDVLSPTRLLSMPISEWYRCVVSLLVGVALDRWDAVSLTRTSTSPAIDAFGEVPRPIFGSAAHDQVPQTILVDDRGHSKDFVAEVAAAWSRVWPQHHAEAFEGAVGTSLRSWIATEYFDWQTTKYTIGKRKAPLYWQIAVASGSYSVWFCIQHATADTLFRVLNEFVGPKLDHEKYKLDRLSHEAGDNPSAAPRREIEQQETFVGELQALKTEVARVAPLWKPNLDDGVILNFAPLWRLVPQSRSWQVECKKAWDKLVAGDYDWAHIAMHFWPERVVLKCIDDRSLAIAHGLEDVFWHEDDSGTWRKSRVVDAAVQKLIEERTSPTVKAGLKELLSAAAPTASKGRKAKARSASPRTSAPKPAPAAAGATTLDAVYDEATLRAVKATIASVADGASKADVLAATGLSDSDWNKAIAALLDRGDVTRTGQKRGTRYHADSAGEDG